ncbi:MAG: thiolase family protein [Chthoniobacter sp.]|uniref:thiolase family protein n=1 Tax=Chthoniobacter sp. TaxID=2510640 RepID=UPI0032AC16C8
MSIKPIWIVSAKRTPQGRFLGGLAKKSAVELGVVAAKAALSGIDGAWVDSVIVGNVLGAGLGMNVARQVALGAGLPVSVPACTVNMMCASGMQAVRLAVQAIGSGEARVVLCGGTESMSNAPYLLNRARGGYKLGDGVLIDSLLRDGLTDAFSDEHMGVTAERLATRYGISRAAQDAFAVTSQQRYAAALAAGHFREEIVAVDKVEQDEHPRADTTVAKLGTLKAAFDKSGTVTAGNSSGLNDGAAMLLVCEEERGRELGLTPLVRITASVAVGCEPAEMGLGPVYATRRISRDVGEFDLIELNEAFAAQSLACIQELGLDAGKVNVDGGAIALGHPIGASGARLLVHLTHRKPRRGLATLCVGGGMGCAMVLERA